MEPTAPIGQDLQEGQQFEEYQVMTVRPSGYTEHEAVVRRKDGKIAAVRMLNWDKLKIHYQARYFREAKEPPDPKALAERALAKIRQRDAEFRACNERAVGITHPALAAVHKIGTIPKTGQTFVECDYVAGAPLLQEATGMTWLQRLYFVPWLLEGLQVIHDRGFLHGNIKHRRIRATYQDGGPVAKWTDTGFCVPIHQWPITLLGSAEYLPPEVILQKQDQIDQQSAGRDLKQLATMIEAESAPLPPSTYVREIPKSLDDVIMALLEKDPAKRPFNSAGDLAAYFTEQWPEACQTLQTADWTVSVETRAP
ncbi:MAG: hypothetical protein HYV03_03600 [Deltaproteobacteria bacterium]|nr:hypothetical protein [Deltaproteobacteria bacterium]